MAELLEQTRAALNERESALKASEQQIGRLQRVISDQQYTVQQLEEEALAARHSAEISSQSILPVDH